MVQQSRFGNVRGPGNVRQRGGHVAPGREKGQRLSKNPRFLILTASLRAAGRRVLVACASLLIGTAPLSL